MSKAKPSWPQIGAPLDGVNADFHQAYEALSQSATQAFPMFVLIDHELVIVWNQCERRIPITPRAFHVLKSVAHAPVGVYALLLPACDGPLPPQLRSHVQAALERLPVELPDAHETAKQVIETTRAFLSQVLADQAVTKAALDNFAQVMGPRLLELTDAATRLALASLHAAVQEALASLPEPTHPQLQVVVVCDHQARGRSLHVQYFRKRLSEPEGAEDRVAFAEGAEDVTQALALVGTRQLDRQLARAFFGEPRRLQTDVLGDSAKAILDGASLERIGKPESKT